MNILLTLFFLLFFLFLILVSEENLKYSKWFHKFSWALNFMDFLKLVSFYENELLDYNLLSEMIEHSVS